MYEDPASIFSLFVGSIIAKAAKTIVEIILNYELYDCTSDGQCAAITVIGNFLEYLKTAKDVGGKVFQLPPELEVLSEEQVWVLDQQFLDNAIANGDTFIISNPWLEANPGSFYLRELQYLFNKRYTLS